LGSAWKFALQEVTKNIDDGENYYNKFSKESMSPEEHPFYTVQSMLEYEIEVLKKPLREGKGAKILIDLLHMVNYMQALLEEIQYGKSSYIYNEFVTVQLDSSGDTLESSELKEEFDECDGNKEQKEKKKKSKKKKDSDSISDPKTKALRHCAYDAYANSLAPKHPKTIRCMYLFQIFKFCYNISFRYGMDCHFYFTNKGWFSSECIANFCMYIFGISFY